MRNYYNRTVIRLKLSRRKSSIPEFTLSEISNDQHINNTQTQIWTVRKFTKAEMAMKSK